MADVNIKQDQNLERSILGCLLQDGSLINNESVAKLKPSDFKYEDGKTVFQLIKELELTEESIDTTTIINRLKENDELEKGVIRRARIQGWWCSEPLTLDTASELTASLANSPLPLTT